MDWVHRMSLVVNRGDLYTFSYSCCRCFTYPIVAPFARSSLLSFDLCIKKTAIGLAVHTPAA